MSLIKSNRNKDFFPSVFSDLFDDDRFLGRDFFNKTWGDWVPAVNVKESNTEFSIEMAAPGFEKADFRISAENDVLTVSAEKKVETTKEDEKFTRKEFSFNSFRRSFTLPQNTNAEKIEAKYENGLLRLLVPKKEVTPAPKRKDVEVK